MLAVRDRREGHAWSLAQTVKNEALWIAARVAIAALGALPRA